MLETKRDSFEELLKLGDNLPVAVRLLDAPPTEEELKLFQMRNSNVVTLLAANSDIHEEPIEEDSPFAIDMQRMQAKMDVMLMVFSDLLMQSRQPLPERMPIQLNGIGVAIRGLNWNDGAQAPVVVVIHFDECQALPLEIPAMFAGMSKDPEPQAVFIFEGVGAKFEQAMETFVFRRDRRKLALRRSAK